MSVNSVSAVQGETSSIQLWLSRYSLTAYFLIAFGGA